MMISKMIEVRDRGTFIPMLAVQLDPGARGDPSITERNRHLLARAGFGIHQHEQAEYVLLIQINGGAGRAYSDPWAWDSNARTYHIAHRWIIGHFDEIKSGDVVDVQFILGETSEPKRPEQEEIG